MPGKHIREDVISSPSSGGDAMRTTTTQPPSTHLQLRSTANPSTRSNRPPCHRLHVPATHRRPRSHHDRARSISRVLLSSPRPSLLTVPSVSPQSMWSRGRPMRVSVRGEIIERPRWGCQCRRNRAPWCRKVKAPFGNVECPFCLRRLGGRGRGRDGTDTEEQTETREESEGVLLLMSTI